MNFNVYVPQKLGEEIAKIAKEDRCSRNAIIVEALEAFVRYKQGSSWPQGFFDFEPIGDLPDFKAMRKEFKAPPEDPLL